MVQYRCPRCNERFFARKVDINQRHGCGEFAFMVWGFEFVDESLSKEETVEEKE